MSGDPRRPSFGAVRSNWRRHEGSFLTKLRLASRNTWIKLRTRQNCCGNAGDPGC